MLGPIPNSMIKKGARSDLFDLQMINKIRPWPLDSVLVKKYKMNAHEADSLANFLSCMLRILPMERMSADVLLHHDWLKRST